MLNDRDNIVVLVDEAHRTQPYGRSRDEEERLLDRFRDADDPLKLLVVTAKLLTGFDAPILQALYLDKPLRDHTLLQAICRTNRPYGDKKTHGLIVDYLGVFDDVAKALEFDEKGFRGVVGDVARLKDQLPEAMPTDRPRTAFNRRISRVMVSPLASMQMALSMASTRRDRLPGGGRKVQRLRSLRCPSNTVSTTMRSLSIR